MRTKIGILTGALAALAGCAVTFSHPVTPASGGASSSSGLGGSGGSGGSGGGSGGGPSLPVLNVATSSVDAGSQAPVSVTLSAPATQPVTFTYTTTSGTAQSGTDFTGATGSVTIPAGSTSFTIPVITASGGAGKSFTVTLSSVSSGAQAGTLQSTVSIVAVPGCSGAFTPLLTQLGGGFQTAGGALIHDVNSSCDTWVAGTNLLTGSGTGTIPLATEYGSGGSGATSVVLSEFDYQGQLVWTSEYAYTNAIAHVTGLVRDSSGNFYVGGYVACALGQSCSFGGGLLGPNATGLNASGNSDAFIIKFSSLGVYQWTSRLGGGAYSAGGPSITAGAMAIDSGGKIYLTGGARNNLGSSGGNLDGSVGAVNQTDAYIAQFTPGAGSATLGWTSELGDEGCSGTCAGISEYAPTALAIDAADGAVDIAGGVSGSLLGNQWYFGSTDIGGYLINWYHGALDAFVAQVMISNGNFNWSSQYTTGSSIWTTGLQLDSSGNLWVGGYTEGVMGGSTGYNGGSSSNVFTMYGQHGVKDAFLIEFQEGGGSLAKVTEFGKLGASITTPAGSGNMLAKDSSNFYLAAQTDTYLGGNCYFGCGVSTDAVLMQASGSGGFDGWFTEIGPVASGVASLLGLGSDGNGNSYLASLVSSVIGTQYGVHAQDTLLSTIDASGQMSAASSAPPAASTAPLWPLQQGGAAATTKATGVAVEGGSSYVVGSSTATLSGATLFGTASSGAGTTAVVTQFGAAGAVAWTSQLGTGTATDQTQATGVVVDSGGNAYVTGTVKTAGVIHGGTQLGSGAGNTDLFISEITSAGAQGALQLQYGQGGAAALQPSGIARDSSGTLYVVGTINQRFTGSHLHGAVGNSDLFVAAFASGGTLSWSAELGAAGQATSGSGIVLDGAGHVDVVGTTDANTLLGASQFGSYASTDLVVAQFNAGTGNFGWVAQLAGAATQGAAIALDESGNIVVTGNTTLSSAFPAGTAGGAQQYGYVGSPNLVIASFSAAGGATALNWANQLGAYAPCQGGEACGGLLQAATLGTGVAVDSAGNLWVSGYTNGVVPGESQYRAHAGGGNTGGYVANDALLAEFSASGAYQWTSQLGYSEQDTEAYGIAPSAVSGTAMVLAGFTDAFLGGTEAGALGTYDLFLFPATAAGALAQPNPASHACEGTGAAITRVGVHDPGGYTSGTTTSAIAFTENAHDLLIAGVTYEYTESTELTMSDTAGNTWYPLPVSVASAKTCSTGGVSGVQLWYAPNIKGGANTVQGTFPVGTNAYTVVVEYSGVSLSPQLQVPSDVLAATSPLATTHMASGTVTAAGCNNLVIGLVGDDNSGLLGAAAGYSNVDDPLNWNMIIEDNIAAAPGTYSPTATTDPVNGYPTNCWAGVSAAFPSQ